MLALAVYLGRAFKVKYVGFYEVAGKHGIPLKHIIIIQSKPIGVAR